MPGSSSTMSTFAIGSSSVTRQLEREAAAPADLALEPDAASVGLHDVADDGEPEAGGPHHALGSLHEPLEYPVALLGRDAGARIGDDHPYRAVVRRRVDPDSPAAWGIAKGVHHQV